MNNLNTAPKLGKRLQQIQVQLKQSYDHIWDCCCDHGLLGFSLLDAQLAKTVHFVDIVPELLQQIEQSLDKHWKGSRNSWQVHCLSAGDLPLKQYSSAPQTDTHVIIIAGIGGDLMIELLTSLSWVAAQFRVEFILCPVHHNYKVRQFLLANHYALINESLVFENKRGYEILHVSTRALLPLTVTGSIMWDLADPLHLAYLHKTIAHYQRIAKNPDADVRDIINHYQALLMA